MSKFLRNDSPMTLEWVSEKISSLKYEHIIYSFEACNLKILDMQLLSRNFKFLDFMNTLRNFEKFVFARISRNLSISREKFILTESPDHVP